MQQAIFKLLSELEIYDNDEQIRNLSKQIADIKGNGTLRKEIDQCKKDYFNEDYEATDSEALGVIIAQFYKHIGLDIMKTLVYALEDANFHTVNTKLETTWNLWVQKEFEKSEWKDMKVNPRFEIRRFYQDIQKDYEVIKRGLTRQQAIEHCEDPSTRKEGEWFDGWETESEVKAE